MAGGASVNVLHPAQRLREIEGRARRRFGQNFLVSEAITASIVALAGVKRGERVLEIGPGLGVLTVALLRAGAEVEAIELDRDLAAALPEVAPGVRLHVGDAMRLEIPKVDRIVANLPYNVATPLMLRLLNHAVPMALMFQREVADRIEADPGSRTYGSLSVQIAARASVTRLLTLPPEAFHPAPKVHSAVVGFYPHQTPDFGGVTGQEFDKVVRLGFSARRKTLLNAFTPALGREAAAALLANAQVSPGDRAERIDVAGWRRLAAAYGSR